MSKTLNVKSGAAVAGAAPCSVERTTRSVIERKLLTALEDDNTVAALLSKQDLEDMIFALCRSAALNDWDKKRVQRCHDLRDCMQQLMREAFPPNAGTQRPGESDAPIANQSAPPGSLK